MEPGDNEYAENNWFDNLWEGSGAEGEEAAMDILKRIAEHREREHLLKWEGTFAEYLDIVRERPYVAQTAHARVYNMIASQGVEKVDAGNQSFRFFSRELFGLDRAIERLVEEYFHSAAKRLDV